MKTIYTAIPLAVLAAVAQSQEHGYPHDSGVHDFLGGNTEKGDFLGDTYDHDFLGDGFNKPHKKPEGHGPEQGPSAGALNVPRDGAPEFDAPFAAGFDAHNAASDTNSPKFNSPTISPDVNSPISGPHNFNAQKGPHTNSGDNEVDGGINNDNIVITPVAGYQGQLASEQDNYIAPPPPPPPFPHGGPPPEGPPHGAPPHEEGGEHGPEQLPAGQHSEPQHHVPGPPAEIPHPEGGPDPAPSPEHHDPPAPKEEKPEPAPPAPQGPPQQAPQEPPHQPPHHEESHAPPPAEYPVREFPAQSQEERPHPDRQGEQATPCTFHNHETPYPQARPQPAAPQPEFDQDYPKSLGSTPGAQRGESEAYPAHAHVSYAAQSSAAYSSVQAHNTKPSSEALPHVSYHVEAHSSFVVAKPSHTPSTTSASRVAATTAPHPGPSGPSSAFVGGAGSFSVPQGFGMAVAGALAFLL